MTKILSMVAVCGLLLVGACASDDVTPGAKDAPTVGDPATPGLFALDKGGSGPTMVAGDEGVAGETAAPVGEASKVNCSTIQWCNEPGPNGTICIWNACSFTQAYNECVTDANYVCGGIKQPAYIR
jgi:hypothetical protein